MKLKEEATPKFRHLRRSISTRLLRSNLYENQIILVAEFAEFIHIGRIAKEVGLQISPGFWG
jgi:hypothetical protein